MEAEDNAGRFLEDVYSKFLRGFLKAVFWGCLNLLVHGLEAAKTVLDYKKTQFRGCFRDNS